MVFENGLTGDDPVTLFLERLELHGLENTFARRYYSKYEGFVVANEDPQGQDRLKVRVPALGRTAPLDLWAYPSSPYAGNNYGFYFPAEVGDAVWVWFEHGDPTIPNISGGWWCAPNSDILSSHVPTEFKHVVGAAPSTRGIKVKRGHTLLFEESDLLDPRVEIFTSDLNEEGVSAIKYHSLVMSNLAANPRIVVTSNAGHQILLQDLPETKMTLQTPGLNCLIMHDTEARITIETQALNLIEMSDSNQTIKVESSAGRKIEIKDTTGTITVEGITGTKMTVSDTDLAITVETPAGSKLVVSDTLGITLDSPTVVTAKATTALTLEGATVGLEALGGAMTLAGTGALNSTFGGNVTTQAPTINMQSALVQLGLGALLSLIDERFLVLFNTHTHLGNLGAPTTPPLLPVVPATVTTVNTKAS